ncbi:MAG TPA: glutamine--tRNA ligase/YqeY domain fusion protein [Bacteroidales bacterium]|jgi:glutaminyl-tRNA synthetase|nr:MAG: Glutamine--tRNA ligase [Bacteroidetes bacterium ADurb.Bin012]HNQ60316.1 glutamine--tRNA ligase/YqeY domain fusion protein [Bacteroidales bacterium]HNU21995.1 glutamine--tRNA ligase/YqeY domain fusion protein [Bacteroidales bacterium]HNV17550.1 glutamine--tRNA ligase/YqeY domain fusion protein [Bacteroidales bacterium]HNZ79760.1 glutamine--tRNA ligase/YqeY domain fusion protein [Bacteroidales bacterium]
MNDRRTNHFEENSPNEPDKTGLNFIEEIIEEDLRKGKNRGRVHTRFPPEPNGYLHIGHAKSICLNFGLAQKYGGFTNLRFDDTNPTKEGEEYVDAIKEDIRWLGFSWDDRDYYASDYFDQLYEWAEKLILEGKAYVDDQSAEEISRQRGTITTPGIESPYRNRSVEENLNLFRRMRAGEFPDGHCVLRAKIDMSHPNMLMRDPIMYRIIHTSHHRTGDKWCIYPMYDYAHGQSDYIEGITHSICTLEFEIHRPLYDWFLDQIVTTEYRPRQIEFARLNLTYTIMSKRKLLELVKEGYVKGWDDPRMPTICGLRRRGYTPASIRNFAEKIGVARRDNIIDVSLLEFSLREDLNKTAQRRLAVLNPLHLIIENFPQDETELLPAANNPEDTGAGIRKIPFSRELWIERDDFMIDPPKKYYRLYPGSEVRLKYGYIIKCQRYETDPESGEVKTVYCTYDPESKTGGATANRKIKGTIHWVSKKHALKAEIRLYDRLFIKPDPDDVAEGESFINYLNPDSLKIMNAWCEPALMDATTDKHYQFERIGYFYLDPDSCPGYLVFNRTVSLKDSWSKMSQNEE